MPKFFVTNYKGLRLRKEYVLYAIMYGISTLIIPLATQYLVNQLSLSALLVNTLTFLLVLGILLVLSQLFKYCQVIFSEYIQREIFMTEASTWMDFNRPEKAPYFFEVHNAMKSFSTALSHVVELALLLIFGLLVVMTFHPAFLIIVVFLALTIFLIFRTWDRAISASLEESNQKYRLFFLKADGSPLERSDLMGFLRARDLHFSFVRRNKIIVALSFVVIHLFLLGMGIYLIQNDQLSLGQLVSAEIIISGIMASLTRFPKTLEDIYDYETSKIKLKEALKGATYE